jgi:hypothetical protein
LDGIPRGHVVYPHASRQARKEQYIRICAIKFADLSLRVSLVLEVVRIDSEADLLENTWSLYMLADLLSRPLF